MKLQILQSTFIAAIAVTALSLASCNKAPESSDGSPSAGSGSQDPAKEMIGYWGAEKDSLTKMVESEMSDGDMPPAVMEKLMGPVVEAMADIFAFELTSDRAFSISPDGYKEEGTYEIVSTDASTGDFVVKTTNVDDGKVEENKGNVRGDTMTLTKEGMTMELNRITQAEFEDRKAKAADFDMQALMAPIMQELMKDLGGQGAGGVPPGIPQE